MFQRYESQCIVVVFLFQALIGAAINNLQMVLLYKDPLGKDSGVVNSQTDNTLNRLTSNTIKNNKCEELEKKVTLLEKKVLDKDKIIAELRDEAIPEKCSGDQTKVKRESCIWVIPCQINMENGHLSQILPKLSEYTPYPR